jgi:hypothetical protein
MNVPFVAKIKYCTYILVPRRNSIGNSRLPLGKTLKITALSSSVVFPPST